MQTKTALITGTSRGIGSSIKEILQNDEIKILPIKSKIFDNILISP